MAFISLFLIFSSKLVCLVTSYGKLHLQKSCFFLKTLFSDMYGLYLYWNLTTGRLVYKYGHIHCFPLSIKSIQFMFYYLLVFLVNQKKIRLSFNKNCLYVFIWHYRVHVCVQIYQFFFCIDMFYLNTCVLLFVLVAL